MRIALLLRNVGERNGAAVYARRITDATPPVMVPPGAASGEAGGGVFWRRGVLCAAGISIFTSMVLLARISFSIWSMASPCFSGGSFVASTVLFISRR